jgi:hypothetical protein
MSEHWDNCRVETRSNRQVDGLIWLFGLNSSMSNVREHGYIYLGSWVWPYLEVILDASARAASISYADQS